MDLSSKFSLYDVLAIIIPGGFIMVAVGGIDCVFRQDYYFESCCGIKIPIVNDIGITESIAILCVAYIIGLINNWLCDGIFRGFRNFVKAIDNELIKVIKSNNIKHTAFRKYFDSKHSFKCLATICLSTLLNIIKEWVPCKSYKQNNTEYYNVYYALTMHNLLGKVPLLETQVSLLRNSLIPLTIITSHFSLWAGVATPILIFIVMVQRQNKVYSMVWESANYYHIQN